MSEATPEHDTRQRNLDPNRTYCYGWGFFQPRCLQKPFNNAKAFLVLLTLANIMQGIVINGLLKVSVTSIERRFNFLSSESGLIVSGYDIAGCLSLLPISYLGGKGHKPRWIGWGLVITSIGSLVLALPHFLTGPYEYTLGPPGTTGQSPTGDKLIDNLTGSYLCKQVTQPFYKNSTQNLSVECQDVTRMAVSYVSINQMKYVFLFGQFLTGIGCTPLSVLGVVFIDESVDPQVYPMYIGFYYMGALIGPALGFILGGQLLKVFTEVGVLPGITPESPQWVGAWWVGFMISAAVIFVLAIPVLGYPRKLPSTFTRKLTMVDIKGQQYSSNRDDSLMATVGSKGHAASLDDEESCQIRRGASPHVQQLNREQSIPLQRDALRLDGIGESPVRDRDAEKALPTWPNCGLVENFVSDLLQVITNKAFIYLSMAAAVLGTLVSGFSTFGPKFIESQFGKSASDAANLFGYVCIPAGAGGMLVGSFLMSGLKLGYRSSLRMCFCVSLLGLFALFALTLHCDDIPLAGINQPYTSQSPEAPLSMSSTCNEACNCASGGFDPVCGSDGVTYSSACLAGCMALSPDKQMYTNCSCIPNVSEIASQVGDNFTDSLSGSLLGTATRGKCFRPCWWHDVILVGLFLVISTTFICAVPGVDLSLRCFPQRLRSLSVGVQWILIRTLGTIPGPIIFGAMIDSTCQIWSQNQDCSKDHGSCMMYKNQELSFSLLILSVIYKGASILFFGLTLMAYKPARLAESTGAAVETSRQVVESPL